MGMLTPTNSPFCSAGPTESTVLPSTMPIAMASTIHITRKRSRKESPRSGGSSFISSANTRNGQPIGRNATSMRAFTYPIPPCKRAGEGEEERGKANSPCDESSVVPEPFSTSFSGMVGGAGSCIASVSCIVGAGLLGGRKMMLLLLPLR